MRYKKASMGLNDDNTRHAHNCDGDTSSPINNTDDIQPDSSDPPPLQLSLTQQPKMDSEEDNKSASSVLHPIYTSHQLAQPVEYQTPHFHSDNIDGHIESRKRGRLTKGSAYKPDEMHGTFSQTSAENEDEYDIEEEDVKVCDICGDAGREDLLAVCSRCSDGAEHTYCMHEMLDKVPDGDWLCEECKYNGELEELRQEHYKMHGMSERSKFLGRTASVNNDFVKSDGKDPLRDRSKMKNVGQKKQVSSKRCVDSFEAGPAKRQAVESSMESPTTSSSSLAAALKDNRNLDKIKGKSFNKIPTCNESTGDSSETVCSPTSNSVNASKGNFTKSNSFSSGNSKLNVKVSDEPQKQKHGIDAKDMSGKLITKSMSFKGLGRSNVSEPKVKMLSPPCAPVQEFKGLKQGRERISLERKNTIKPDQSTPGQMATITSKRSSRGDKISSLSVSNNRDHKNCQSDGKLTTPSKHSCQSQAVHKFSEATANTEVKRQLSTSTIGSVPINGTGSSPEARPNPVSITELPGLNLAQTADRCVIGDNGAKADVLDSQNEKTVENSYSRLRQGVNDGVAGGNRRELSTDSSTSRTKEGIHKENNLKAAIEAAMQKKQDMFRKNRNLDKSIELSTSNSQGNHVGVAVLNISSDASSEDGVLDGDAALRNHISNSCKSTSGGSMKLLKVYPACGGTSVGDSVLTVSAIPEEESVWQGGFEIHRNGKFPDMCGGFQAHLSSTAARKVLAVVKKFPQKIVLDEVPRPCVWPMQFKEIGAREDNVAVYFFAKDSESYLRSYKMLVDYLMKHDLALRGHVNEVELLVFPSNHLPDKSQCWNAFFFMWGVFRGRRPLCPDNRYGLQKTAEICMSNWIPLCKDVASTPCDDETLLHRPAVEDVNVSGTRNRVVSRCDTPASVRSSLQHHGSLSNGDCYNERCPRDRTCSSSHPSSEKPLRGPHYNFSISGAEASSESESAALNDLIDQAPVVVNHQRLAANKIDRGNHLLGSHESPSYHVQDKQDISSRSCVRGQAGGHVVGSVQCGLDIVNDNIDRVKSKSSLNPDLDCVDNIKKNLLNVKVEDDVKHKVDGIDPMQKDSSKLKLKCSGYVDVNVSADDNMDKLWKMQFSPMKDLTNSTMQAASQNSSWINGEDTLESRDEASIKGGNVCDLNGLQSCLRSNDDDSRSEQAQTSSHTQEREDTCDDDKSGSSDTRLEKRYLFLDDSHTGTGIQSGLGDEPMYWKVGLSEDEERLPDGSPNLDLALGVEKKQSRSDIIATSSKEEKDEDDASASLSLSLAFPLSRPPVSVEMEQTHEISTSMHLFRGSSHK